jgi:hypothetical protein
MTTRTKVIITAVSIAAAAFGFIILYSTNTAPYQSADYIGRHVINGKIVDYVHDISNEPLTIGHIKWKVNPKGVYFLQYGKIQIELPPKLLEDKTMQEKLRKIGIAILKNKETGGYKFQWNGSDVDETAWNVNKID